MTINELQIIKNTYINQLKARKEELLPELFSWVTTFEPMRNIRDYPEDEEEYSEVFDLMTRFREDKCDENDFSNILFHISQMNYSNDEDDEEEVRIIGFEKLENYEISDYIFKSEIKNIHGISGTDKIVGGKNYAIHLFRLTNTYIRDEIYLK